MVVTRGVKSRISLDITGMELGITSNLNSISSFFWGGGAGAWFGNFCWIGCHYLSCTWDSESEFGMKDEISDISAI